MAKKKRKLVKLQCKKCKRVNYFEYKNPRSVERKLEFKKFCNWCRATTVHKEGKK